MLIKYSTSESSDEAIMTTNEQKKSPSEMQIESTLYVASMNSKSGVGSSYLGNRALFYVEGTFTGCRLRGMVKR